MIELISLVIVFGPIYVWWYFAHGRKLKADEAARKRFSGLTPLYHWPSRGRQRVPVVGESYYRSNIAKIAKNTGGEHANRLCEALLVPDNNNPHDANAVAVVIDGLQVGYLSREHASTFRTELTKAAGQLCISECTTVINWGGLGRDNVRLDYSVRLDVFALDPDGRPRKKRKAAEEIA